LGELFAEAGAVVYPERPPVALNIKATSDGSFIVDLVLQASGAWDQIIDIFGSETADALANLVELVGGASGLFWFIKRLRNRRIEAEASSLAPGQVMLTLDDGTTIEIHADALALYRNIRIRRKAREVVEPLVRDGVERLDVRSEGETTVSLAASDVLAFEPPADDVPLLESEREMVVAIAAVAFIEGNKWRLSDGDHTFYALIEDEGFLDRVDRGIESFRKGDFLRCKMRVVQFQRGPDLHTEYRVIDVIEHIPTGTQMGFGGGAERPMRRPE
jgi:hypothetical protein